MLEDMATDAELVAYELRKGGLSFSSKRVDSKEEFVKALSELLPDIILADYHLPQFTGMEAFRLKVESGSDASFIIVSGALSEEVAVECMKEGVDDYVLKSNLKRLASAVRGALEKRDLRSGEAKALASLKESEARYKRITEAITDYVYTVFVENGLPVRTIHRPGSESVTGYTPDEFERSPFLWFDLVLEEDRKSVDEFARNIIQRKEVNPIEHRIRKKGGDIRWVKNSPVLNLDPDGRLISYDSLIQDITERKEADLKLVKEREILSHLLMIAEATASITNMDKLLAEVARRTVKVKGCEYCLVYLWDREKKCFQPAQQVGLSHAAVPLFRTRDVCMDLEFVRKAFEEKRPTYWTFGSAEDERPPEALSFLKDAACCIVIPLMGKGVPLGMILSACKVKCGFSDWDIKLLQGISNQVSVSLEQSRLYNESIGKTMELSNKVLTIEVMHEIGRSILSTLEPLDILETVVRMTSRIIPCEGTAILLVDKERNGFVYECGTGLPFVSEDVFIPYCDTLASEILETGMPQYFSSLAEMKDLPLLEDGLLKDGYLSHVRVPIVVKNEIIGILMVDSTKYVFIPNDLVILEKLAYQVGIALQNSRQLADLEELFFGTLKSLSSAIDAKSKWTAGHSLKVAQLSVRIGKELDLSAGECKKLELASLLHDIGKIGTYENILEKPGKLTSEEEEIMKLHPGKGAEILEHIKQLKEVIPAIKYHQERFDGTGYPEGLRGEGIPFPARILAVADTIEAMMSDRPYRKGKTVEEIIHELKSFSGTQFDPVIVDAVLKMLRK